MTPCLVQSADYGVFVAPNGLDNATGKPSDPLKTIAAGITKAVMTGTRRVFVCTGIYDEHLVVGAALDGVKVYGGFDCTNAWSYAATNAVKVKPSTTGYALEVDMLTSGATFEDLEFDAIDGANPGDSSIAVFANQSVATFTRVTTRGCP